MEFNAKFLLVAACLSLIAEALQIIVTLLDYISSWRIATLSWIWLGLAPLQLLLGVALPFAIMYILSTKMPCESAYRPIMISTFLGCWIGQLASLIINTSITYVMTGGYSGTYLFYAVVLTLWQVFAQAFSSTFFISLGAILLAYYQQTTNKPPSPIPTPLQ